jgi:calcineurin-like phosphoesterase family protein
LIARGSSNCSAKVAQPFLAQGGVCVKLGLITDIHEQAADLRLALAQCDRHRVDRIICLGDVFQTGEAIHETVSLLAQRRVPGVWGNHDFGLCGHPSALVCSRRVLYAGPVLDYLATFKPCLEFEDCLFSHVEPWRDLNHVMGLWYSDGLPNIPEKAARSFDACTNRVMFTGHHHRWLVTTRENAIPWDGTTPIRLEPPQRYLVVIAAVCEGYCAIYDTRSCELIPVSFR